MIVPFKREVYAQVVREFAALGQAAAARKH